MPVFIYRRTLAILLKQLISGTFSLLLSAAPTAHVYAPFSPIATTSSTYQLLSLSVHTKFCISAQPLEPPTPYPAPLVHSIAQLRLQAFTFGHATTQYIYSCSDSTLLHFSNISVLNFYTHLLTASSSHTPVCTTSPPRLPPVPFHS